MYQLSKNILIVGRLKFNWLIQVWFMVNEEILKIVFQQFVNILGQQSLTFLNKSQFNVILLTPTSKNIFETQTKSSKGVRILRMLYYLGKLRTLFHVVVKCVITRRVFINSYRISFLIKSRICHS